MSIRLRSLVEPVRRYVWSNAETGSLAAELLWGASIPVAVIVRRVPKPGESVCYVISNPSVHKLADNVRRELELQEWMRQGEQFADGSTPIGPRGEG